MTESTNNTGIARSDATLYVCATPIGHLGDVTHRLLETLTHVAVVAAEDTRVAQKLLQRFGLSKRLLSIRQHNERAGAQSVLGYLAEGQAVAYVSDAGTPGVCDPGQYLVTAVRRAGYAVVPIPGPSAVATFLSVSGLAADQWVFGGFFPRKASEADGLIASARRLQIPIVFFDSPKRIHESMAYLVATYPVVRAAFARELTKQFETVWEGPSEDVLGVLSQYPQKGEWLFGITLLPEASHFQLNEVVQQLQQSGLDKRQIVEVAKRCFGFSRNEVYRLLETKSVN